MPASKIPIHEFTNAIAEFAENLSKAELVRLLLALAEELPADSRADFLHTLRRLQAGKTQPVHYENADAVIAKIDVCRDEVLQRQECIENGNYEELDDWDEDDWQHGDYHDDEPEVFNTEYEQIFSEIIADTDNRFLDGDTEGACRIYKHLLKFNAEMNCCGADANILTDTAVCANYCRCVYELVAPQQRPAALLEALLEATDSQTLGQPSPTSLSVVLKTRNSPPDDLDTFLPAWTIFLRNHPDGHGRVLYVEALLLAGATEQARHWLEIHDNAAAAWLFFLNFLHDRNQWSQLAACCAKASAVLQTQYDQQEVAKLWIEAGKQLDEPTVTAAGLRHAFQLAPGVKLIRELLAHITNRDQQAAELEAYARMRGEDKSFSHPFAVVELLRGRLDVAYEQSRDCKSLGWSFGRSPLPAVVAGGLMAVCPADQPLPPNVHAFCNRYLTIDHPVLGLFPTSEPDDDADADPAAMLINAIRARMAELRLSAAQKQMWLQTLRTVLADRADAIVAGKYRQSYGKAAEGLAAWAEAARANGQTSQATEFITEFRDIRFKRFRAFHAELTACLNRRQ